MGPLESLFDTVRFGCLLFENSNSWEILSAVYPEKELEKFLKEELEQIENLIFVDIL